MISPLEIQRGSILCYDGEARKVAAAGEHVIFEGKLKMWIGGSQINGEPLSEIWLMRLGFIQTPDSWDKGKVSIILKEHYQYPKGRVLFNSYTIWEEQPEYVHQIQLLYFALTREHLKLAKIK